MRNPTPFFAAFRKLLFGRPSRPSAKSADAARKASDSIGELRELFGSMIPVALLGSAESGEGSRERLFGTSVTFWAFLSQVLSPDSACRHAVRKLQAWGSFEGIADMSSSTAAYCKARLRLAVDTLVAVHRHIASRLERNTPTAALWCKRRVKVVDGTGISMPDTPENQ